MFQLILPKTRNRGADRAGFRIGPVGLADASVSLYPRPAASDKVQAPRKNGSASD